MNVRVPESLLPTTGTSFDEDELELPIFQPVSTAKLREMIRRTVKVPGVSAEYLAELILSDDAALAIVQQEMEAAATRL
jgi:hypothetical protein